MGDEDDRLAHLRLEAEKFVLEAVAGDGVDRSERFVHEHDLRVCAQCARHPDALLLTAGELLGIAVAVFGGVHVHHGEELVDPGADPFGVPTQQLGDRGDVLPDRHVREQARLLNDVSDPAAQLIGILGGDVLAVEDDPPR